MVVGNSAVAAHLHKFVPGYPREVLKNKILTVSYPFEHLRHDVPPLWQLKVEELQHSMQLSSESGMKQFRSQVL